MMKSLTFLSTLLLFTISDALHVEEIENYIGFCVDYISFKLSDGTRKTIGSKSTHVVVSIFICANLDSSPGLSLVELFISCMSIRHWKYTTRNKVTTKRICCYGEDV
eukprot:m.13798 g.13798  ORF g.13798 m.13798 type:complete len:107 (-) comp4925_c0_seq2:1079-1399(-)